MRLREGPSADDETPITDQLYFTYKLLMSSLQPCDDSFVVQNALKLLKNL